MMNSSSSGSSESGLAEAPFISSTRFFAICVEYFSDKLLHLPPECLHFLSDTTGNRPDALLLVKLLAGNPGLHVQIAPRHSGCDLAGGVHLVLLLLRYLPRKPLHLLEQIVPVRLVSLWLRGLGEPQFGQLAVRQNPIGRCQDSVLAGLDSTKVLLLHLAHGLSLCLLLRLFQPLRVAPRFPHFVVWPRIQPGVGGRGSTLLALRRS
eukprot:scaffold6922_cov363-Prasinococcus_capsulatus_cf.AAC.6